MSLDFYPAKYGRFTNPFSDFVSPIKADETADDLSDMLSFNQSSAAKLIPLLALPVDEDGAGEIAAADLYQRCHAVLSMNKDVIAEFTCATDDVLAQVLSELGAGTSRGPQVITIGTDADTVEGLRRRVRLLSDLALLTMQRHGAKGCIQMC